MSNHCSGRVEGLPELGNTVRKREDYDSQEVLVYLMARYVPEARRAV